MSRATVYSKDSCSFCVRAKELLTEYSFEYRERDVSNPDIRQELLTLLPNAKTVPQIFIDGSHIGGYSELVTYMEKQR
jgi:glutaredoxin 3